MVAWGAIIGLGMASASTAANVYGQSQANKTNIRLAQENRDFQELMASTRYQRTMADMKAAGLNPILAYKQGGGPVPTGNVANVSNELAGVSTGAAQGVSSGLAVRRQNQEIYNMRATEKTVASEERLNKSNEALIKKQLEIKRLEVASAKAQNSFAQHQDAFWNTRTGRLTAQAAAIHKAYPGSTGDQVAKAATIAAAAVDERPVEITSKPYRRKYGRPTMPKSAQPPARRGRKAGNWQKYYNYRRN